uniref:8 kDa Amblyomma family member n=1 Tax=Rhipicephalus appendiculatus TaxID=34631 RepID=A0A131YF67_RHIAP
MRACRNLCLFLVAVLISLTTKITARPGPPDGVGKMLICGEECFIRSDFNSSGCPSDCRCVSNKFRRGIYTGPGHCWYERWEK